MGNRILLRPATAPTFHQTQPLDTFARAVERITALDRKDDDGEAARSLHAMIAILDAHKH